MTNLKNIKSASFYIVTDNGTRIRGPFCKLGVSNQSHNVVVAAVPEGDYDPEAKIKKLYYNRKLPAYQSWGPAANHVARTYEQRAKEATAKADAMRQAVDVWIRTNETTPTPNTIL